MVGLTSNFGSQPFSAARFLSFNFDNANSSHPARHHLQRCFVRLTAVDVNFIEPVLAHSKSSSKLGFCSLTRCFVEPFG